MRNKHTKFVSLLIIACMVFILAACGKAPTTATDSVKPSDAAAATPAVTAAPTAAATAVPAEPATLTLSAQYSAPDEKLSLDYAIAKIKAILPNVTITIQPSNADDGTQKLKVQASTGDLPDIFNVNPELIDLFNKSGDILQLDGNADIADFKSKMTPGMVDSELMYKGHIYALPFLGSFSIVWYYNKALFAANNVKVPTNYDELTAAVKAFTAKGIVPITIDGKEPWPIGAFLDSFIMRTNPGSTSDFYNGVAKASDPGYKEGIEKAAALIKLGIFEKGATSTDYDSSRALFNTGKAAMLINGDWETPDGITAIGADKLGILNYYPGADAGKEDVNKFAMAGGGSVGGYAVSAKTKDKDLAIKVDALLAYYQGEGRYVKGGHTDVVIKTDGLTTELPTPDITKALTADQGKFIYKSNFNHNLPSVFSKPFGEYLQNLVAGQSADDFIADTDKLIATVNKK
jgi:raffinose/stachyose/melibiose transport system substrate-binding protein